ncbi:GspH/FimT family pseudopilin [Undibacterium sp. LX40W]|uniref:Type II secretion system protein H n=1 Tax=Undibacterium nitidum TaxID=2762298 RepID=A0A923HJY3_9BURK|nr:GspH/FimT family pseudopilin [Undibacterium nitidum]MBC3879763.1 GspH/FimT family pseudopilin [Undibacterium nitidum]MBC3891501.1 GspH/FimT family pseudopilin [Undibacterium sp. LX40W]
MKHKRSRGFTLLELLVVLVIMGIMLGAVSLNAMQSTRQRLQTDAQRISLLLQLAREEAIVRNRPTAFEANQAGYRFLVLNDNRWEQILDLDTLRGREFTFPNTKLEIIPNIDQNTDSLKIIFGREPVSRPFVFNLRVAEDSVSIRADGVGHFVVE